MNGIGSIASSATSALNAFGVDMLVRANNIANINTDGFRSSSLVLTSGPGNIGVQAAAIHRNTAPGPMVPGLVSADVNGRGVMLPGYVEGSNTDLAVEFTGMIATQRAYEANAKVVTVHDSMTGALIDMIA